MQQRGGWIDGFKGFQRVQSLAILFGPEIGGAEVDIGFLEFPVMVQGQHFTGPQLLTEDSEFVLGGNIHSDLQRILGKAYPVKAIFSITFTD